MMKKYAMVPRGRILGTRYSSFLNQGVIANATENWAIAGWR